MKTNTTKKLIETGIFVSIALVLDLIFGSVYSFPFGGSISLAMLPIFIIASRHGWKYGVMAGLIFGLLQSMIKVYFLSLPQYIMDYLVTFMVLGFAGVIPKTQEHSGRFAIGIVLGSLLRLVSSSITGLLFWRAFIPDELAFMNQLFGANITAIFPSDEVTIVFGAFLYNALYLIPSAILCVIIGVIIQKRGLLRLDTPTS
ncbi:MAG: energy-coupled thiamine transporter ThiT [Candidatus Izemoplasmatales bacterium]|nr:energy-coupled thiamine transporter ThiT [Candidatus Izemoplasmatales bacterium]